MSGEQVPAASFTDIFREFSKMVYAMEIVSPIVFHPCKSYGVSITKILVFTLNFLGSWVLNQRPKDSFPLNTMFEFE